MLVCLLNVVVEAYILKHFFKQSVNRKTLSWLLFVKVCSIGIVFANLYWNPIRIVFS